MTTDIDGYPPSVEPGPHDRGGGDGEGGSGVPGRVPVIGAPEGPEDSGALWLQREMRKRMEENARSGRGRHARDEGDTDQLGVAQLLRDSGGDYLDPAAYPDYDDESGPQSGDAAGFERVLGPASVPIRQVSREGRPPEGLGRPPARLTHFPDGGAPQPRTYPGERSWTRPTDGAADFESGSWAEPRSAYDSSPGGPRADIQQSHPGLARQESLDAGYDSLPGVARPEAHPSHPGLARTEALVHQQPVQQQPVRQSVTLHPSYPGLPRPEGLASPPVPADGSRASSLPVQHSSPGVVREQPTDLDPDRTDVGLIDPVPAHTGRSGAELLELEDPDDGSPRRVRVVLSERKGVAKTVRTVVDVQENTAVGALLLKNLIRGQLGMALRVGTVAVVVLVALPILFAVVPGLGRFEVFGLRLPWVLLGVLVYPFLLVLGWWHTRGAEKVEQNFAEHVQD
ncbi:hypothetical protein GCM10009836_62290 [Pseudonocardia ailaonensis]|uniref:Uncharacterized protein n=1 Tax=Pseudonocardia ailaonensis TaxID=367279 RepID=A0ABN2NK47_9PSEU